MWKPINKPTTESLKSRSNTRGSLSSQGIQGTPRAVLCSVWDHLQDSQMSATPLLHFAMCKTPWTFFSKNNSLPLLQRVEKGKAATKELGSIPLKTFPLDTEQPTAAAMTQELHCIFTHGMFWIGRDPQGSSPVPKWMVHKGIKPTTLMPLAPCSVWPTELCPAKALVLLSNQGSYIFEKPLRSNINYNKNYFSSTTAPLDF